MALAHAITDAIVVDWDYQSDYLKILTTRCESIEAFRRLPAGVVFDGEPFALTGWSSDTNRAVYRNDRPVALTIKAR